LPRRPRIYFAWPRRERLFACGVSRNFFEVIHILELKNVTKSYRAGEFTQDALKQVSIAFRPSEFTAVLGESGSGKTTMLNIIGGLDRYDSGDLIINGKSTKDFKNVDWDAYRNNSVGFIFQSYNLIPHINVLSNVEMSLTLSGVSRKERRRRALEALERVGLKEHALKRPNQLSGGQMQRVAIARALVGDPDVILADEPTGALDSATSVQIMDLIREIAKDKLVIMVTHNPKLAEQYATRIIELKDGQIVGDTNPVGAGERAGAGYRAKKTAMHFFTALRLSFHNIMTKKGRTLLTAFASSIGIIGIALILSLSNGFDIQIDRYETDTLAGFPIMISRSAMTVDADTMAQMRADMIGTSDDAYPDAKEVYPYDPQENAVAHKNEITNEYAQYIRDMDPALASDISYTYAVGLNLLAETGDGVLPVGTDRLSMTCLPETNGDSEGIVALNYDVLAGSMPQDKTDVLLVVDNKNRVSEQALEALGLDSDGPLSFDDVLGTQLKLVTNDSYYVEREGFFLPNPDLESLYESGDGLTLRICGIVRIKDGSYLSILSEGLAYTPALLEYVMEQAEDSAIVRAQREADYNVMTGERFSAQAEDGVTRQTLLSYLGAETAPVMINIFPVDFDAKNQILDYLDAYNRGRADEDMVLYNDLAAMISDLSGDIMNAITIVLIAFSAISLVVSVLMIGIITYISVLERTKEIGVLRALGARKKDISHVFNAETFIVGVCSGLLGIGIARLLLFPVNSILLQLTNIENVARMNPLHALALLVVSVLLTVLGGFIPARIAARKDPVEALRTE